MDNRPIGVFDSGLGGLTAVRELRRVLPAEDIVFFGDTGRVPYGSRSPHIIKEYAKQCMDFLEKQNVKMILVACGTVSSVLGEDIGAERKIPCMGVLEPTVKAAVSATKNQSIGLIATAATVASGSYEKLAAKLLPEVNFTGKACPLFVPLVENGYFASGCEVTRLVAKDYLSAFEGKDIDTLILGCTHYPLLYGLIDSITDYKLNLIDSGKEAALGAKELLEERNMLSGTKKIGDMRFFVTDKVEGFAKLGKEFLGEELKNVTRVEIDEL
ncbi:MAG: glutamate racemase [Oscillospiraceae bacterium]|nr:glutamate racemase [Oscillospiraceae bacterium]MBQ6699297.1 glutamate racemase [Oscillospiraceae bacterium]